MAHGEIVGGNPTGRRFVSLMHPFQPSKANCSSLKRSTKQTDGAQSTDGGSSTMGIEIRRSAWCTQLDCLDAGSLG